MSLLVIGNTVVDIIITQVPRLPTWPRHSEFTPANLVLLPNEPLVTLGGNGANAAYVAAYGGARVHLQTNIGEDPLGDVARGWLRAAGCQLLPSRKVQHTAINVTAANKRHARATFFYPGLEPTLPSLRGVPEDTTHVLVCGWPHPPFPQLEIWFRSLQGEGRFTAMDTGPFLGRPWTLAKLKPLFPSLSLLLTNEYEMTTIMRNKNLPACLRKLRQRFDGHVIIKQGSKGALWLPASSDKPRVIKAPQVRAVNTVGAGDSFNGALLAALTLGKDFPRAVKQAARAASAIVASSRGVLGASESGIF